MRHHNDNEELSFTHIAALTANVVRYLSQQKKGAPEEGGAEKNETESSEREKAKRDAVAERVAAIEKFERIARGDDRARRKRNF